MITNSMYTIKQPSRIIIGNNSVSEYKFSKKSLLITSSGADKRDWISMLNYKPNLIFDDVEPNPSIDTVNRIIQKFQSHDFSTVIGLGGGSVLDVAKFVASKLNKFKILIPTNFGSGSEVTRISVLKINGQKTSFHDDSLFADIAIIDSDFLKNTPKEIINYSAIDACAQCTEAFDSKLSNDYTRFLGEQAFSYLEDGILNNNNEKLVMGSLLSGLSFGNASTTLGHALSYVFSNEGISHGHALSFTTTIAHEFNKSVFYQRFKTIVQQLNIPKISLKQDLELASELIMKDRKHINNNPVSVTKNEIMSLLKRINDEHVF
jgi:malonic semialdehyde reductase